MDFYFYVNYVWDIYDMKSRKEKFKLTNVESTTTIQSFSDKIINLLDQYAKVNESKYTVGDRKGEPVTFSEHEISSLQFPKSVSAVFGNKRTTSLTEWWDYARTKSMGMKGASADLKSLDINGLMNWSQNNKIVVNLRLKV